MEENTKIASKHESSNLLTKIALVLILLLIVLNVLRYAAYFEKDVDGNVQISIQNDTNVELEHDVYIDENNVIFLSEDDMKNYFDKDLYYENIENNKRKYISVFENKILEINEDENNMFINDERYKIKAAVINRDGIYYFPISELKNVYNLNINFSSDMKRINIEKLSDKKVVATINKETKVKYKMTDISKNVTTLEKDTQVEIVGKMDKSWTKIKTPDCYVGYVKSSKLENENVERQEYKENDYSRFDVNNATIIEINGEKDPEINEKISGYDSRKAKVKEILQEAANEVVQLKGKSIGVKIDITSEKPEDYYRFLKELKAYLNNMNVCLLVVDRNVIDKNELTEICNIVL